MDDIVLGQLIVLAHKIQETILKDSSKIRGKIMQEVRGPSTVERVRLRKAEVIAVTSRLQGPSRNMVFTCYIDHCESKQLIHRPKILKQFGDIRIVNSLHLPKEI